MKKLFIIFLLAFSSAAYGQITTNTNFTPNISSPIDTRQVIATMGDTTTIAFTHFGAITYVQGENQLYWRHNTLGWIPLYTDANTDDQTISLDSTANTYYLSIEGGNTVIFAKGDADSDPTNEHNTGLTLVGTTLTVTDGGGSLNTSFTGWDTNDSNDLTTSTSFSGDVSGLYNNLQLGTGVVGPTELASTAVTPGSYTNTNLTVDADGRITSASNGSGGITGSGAANKVAYWDGASSLNYNSNFHWDNSNIRLGIGTTVPTVGIDVRDRMYLLRGSNNTMITGGNNNSANADCTIMGYLAGNSANDADKSTFYGTRSGQNVSSGNNNSMFGYYAGGQTTTGYDNVCLGYYAGYANGIGYRNVAIGPQAYQNVAGGNSNAAIGYQAMKDVPGTPSNCLAMGGNALRYMSGNSNTAIGYGAFELGTSGSFNTAFGSNAGRNTDGSYNVFLGYNAGANDDVSNKLKIHSSAAYSSQPLVDGDFSAQTFYINGKSGYSTDGGTAVYLTGIDNANYHTTISVNDGLVFSGGSIDIQSHVSELFATEDVFTADGYIDFDNVSTASGSDISGSTSTDVMSCSISMPGTITVTGNIRQTGTCSTQPSEYEIEIHNNSTQVREIKVQTGGGLGYEFPFTVQYFDSNFTTSDSYKVYINLPAESSCDATTSLVTMIAKRG